jgi:hypothetical protein
MTKKKKTYIIKATITGTVHISVEAEDEEDAKRAFWSDEDHSNSGPLEWEYDDIVSVMEDT